MRKGRGDSSRTLRWTSKNKTKTLSIHDVTLPVSQSDANDQCKTSLDLSTEITLHLVCCLFCCVCATLKVRSIGVLM